MTMRGKVGGRDRGLRVQKEFIFYVGGVGLKELVALEKAVPCGPGADNLLYGALKREQVAGLKDSKIGVGWAFERR